MSSVLSPPSIAELAAVLAGPNPPKFMFFWGHHPANDGSITKSCLSQWWPAPFTVDGIEYRTAEHFMMASKARLFGDRVTFERILKSGHPKQAKELGREVANFNEHVWLQHRYSFVVTGNHAKFSEHPELAAFLLATGQRIIVEASPVDRIWGIGLAADSPDAARPERWKGENLLGFALMDVRQMLLRGTAAP
jgi:ribA/ribD-fused uncharacterized protein